MSGEAAAVAATMSFDKLAGFGERTSIKNETLLDEIMTGIGDAKATPQQMVDFNVKLELWKMVQDGVNKSMDKTEKVFENILAR